MAGLVDRDGDKVRHEEEGEEGLDLEIELWAGVEASEGGAAVNARWLAELGVMAAEGCVCETDEVQAVWDM